MKCLGFFFYFLVEINRFISLNKPTIVIAVDNIISMVENALENTSHRAKVFEFEQIINRLVKNVDDGVNLV